LALLVVLVIAAMILTAARFHSEVASFFAPEHTCGGP